MVPLADYNVGDRERRAKKIAKGSLILFFLGWGIAAAVLIVGLAAPETPGFLLPLYFGELVNTYLVLAACSLAGLILAIVSLIYKKTDRGWTALALNFFPLAPIVMGLLGELFNWLWMTFWIG